LLNEGSGQNMKIIQAFKYGCKRSKIFGNIQVSMPMGLFFSSYVHQGNNLFSVQSRGKQCAFMSLSALLTAQNIPLIDWSKTTLGYSNYYLHPLLRNLGISRGGGALTLEFPGERCINFKFPGEEYINLGISRGEGTLTLKFPGKGAFML
jgi:hypothetical protein